MRPTGVDYVFDAGDPKAGDPEAVLPPSGHQQQRAEIAARFGHWRIDIAAWTIDWSDGVARIFDRPTKATGARCLDEHLDFYHPDDREIVRSRIDAAARGSTAGSAAYVNRGRIVRPDGEIREIMSQGATELDDEGRVRALHGIVVDVTEVLRAERDARTNDELLRTSVETMDQGLIVLGPDEHVRMHNQRARDLLLASGTLLHDGAPLGAIRERLAHAGYTYLPTEMPNPGGKCGLPREPVTYEREGPNGTILEVRSLPMADGGVVRTFTDVTERRKIERALAESEQRFRLLAENAGDVIILADLDTIQRYVSPVAKSVLGYDPDDMIGRHPLAFVHDDDIESYGRILEDVTSGRVSRAVTQHRYIRKDGSSIWVELSINATHPAEDRRPTGFVASLRDISDRKAIETELRISEERLALALASGNDGLWDWNIATGEASVSDHWFSALGYAPHAFPRHIRIWKDLVHPDDVGQAMRLLVKHCRGRLTSFECEYRLRTADGRYRWMLARGKVVARDARSQALRMVGTHIDITQRKETEQAIAHMALHDPLTALPNRSLFRDRLIQECTSAARHGHKFAVLACDLDRFKAVNDALGHCAGDDLLRLVAERLTGVVRDCDTVARFGGDEFAIILSRLDHPHEASIVAQRIISAIESPLELEGQPTSIGISIGIAIGPDDGLDADELFKNADLALYRAKASGRNTFRVFESGKDTSTAQRNLLESDMRDAVRRSGFILHFQPVFAVAGGDIRGFEALLRWQHPTRGAVPPSDFIPMAEETGLINALGDWALREACRTAANWPGNLRIAVNVSALQFQEPDHLKHSVLMALAASGLAADRLELELTESVLMEDSEAVLVCLHRLRALGVRVALDDFGTGFSGLSYLRRFPFDKIKIDRSFIADIDNPDTAAIVRAVIGLGQRAGADITAEGIETTAQFKRIREEGCTEMQGFLFCRPLPPDEVVKLIRRKRARAAA